MPKLLISCIVTRDRASFPVMEFARPRFEWVVVVLLARVVYELEVKESSKMLQKDNLK